MQKKEILAYTLLAFLFGIVFLPILKSGLYSDDIFFFQGTLGHLQMENISFFELVFSDIKMWLNSGRFSPLFYIEIRGIDIFIKDVFHYKFLMYSLNLLAVLTFVFYLKVIGLNTKIILLSLLCLLPMIQLRVSYHDAFTSFHGSYQLIVIINFLALIAFQNFLKSHKNIYWVISVFLWSCSLLFNEMTLVFLPLYFLAVYFFSSKTNQNITSFFRLMPHVFILLSFILFSLYFKWNAPAHIHQYSGLQAAFSPIKMLEVFAYQALSTLPITHFLYELRHHKGNDWLLIKDIVQQFQIMLMIVFVVIFFITKNQIESLKSDAPATLKSHHHILLIALVLGFVPGMMIMFSGKYQAYTKFGNAYLPVFIQNFGIALLLGKGLYHAMDASSKILKNTASFILLLFMFFGAFILSNNFRHVENQNRKVYYPSRALELALSQNLWASVQEGDAIILKNNYHWDESIHYKHLFFEKTKVPVQVYNEFANHDFLKSQMVNVYELYFPPAMDGNEVSVILKTVAIYRKDFIKTKPGDIVARKFSIEALKIF